MVHTFSYSSDAEMPEGGIEPITISAEDALPLDELAFDTILAAFEAHSDNPPTSKLLNALAAAFCEVAEIQTIRVLRVYTARLGTSATSAAIQTRMLGDKRPGRTIAREFGFNPGVFHQGFLPLCSISKANQQSGATSVRLMSAICQGSQRAGRNGANSRLARGPGIANKIC